jgi:hypothetical protein
VLSTDGINLELRNMKLNRYCLSLVLTGCMVPMLAQAASHYVRQGASGNGSDWSNAYSSLPSTLVRGDTYYIAAGSYAGRTFSTPTSGTTPITIKKATASDHGTNTGWADAYGAAPAAFTGGIEFTSSYWLIDGQTGGGAQNRWVGNFGFTITEKSDGTALIKVGQNGTANNVTVRHVDLQGKGSASTQGGSYSNDGLAIYGSSNVTLSHFRMQGVGRCPFFISPINAVIEDGWVKSYHGSTSVHSEVASIWGFSGSVGDVTFRDNLFTDMQSTGGIMWDNSSNVNAKLYVYGNVFYKPAGATWQQANGVIGGWTSNSAFRNALIYNNTFINIDQESLSSFPQSYSGNVSYNNLWYNSQAPNFSKFATHDYNHFIDSGSTQSEPNGTGAASGAPFVDHVNLDFRLKSSTAAGLATSAPLNIDPLGVARGGDGTADRGAFEFGDAGTSAVSPPTNLSVQ